jgi:predicted transglutaminase-like cysteine proteinase
MARWIEENNDPLEWSETYGRSLPSGWYILPSAAAALLVIVFLLALSICSTAKADDRGFALAPFAHTVFCLKYPGDCRARPLFRGGPAVLTSGKMRQLAAVNARVNRAIRPEPNTHGLSAEKWLIAPPSGECHDYAVTKRHDLLAAGWPQRDLLLAEVLTPTNEHHLVLIVRTDKGNLVADNLNPAIRTFEETPYWLVRVQSPANPEFWTKSL